MMSDCTDRLGNTEACVSLFVTRRSCQELASRSAKLLLARDIGGSQGWQPEQGESRAGAKADLSPRTGLTRS